METPTSTRELIGDEREEARETKRFEREENERPDAARGGTAAFASDTEDERTDDETPELLPREQNTEFQGRWEKI